ncbi:MAG: substrate-binding domain-containing protein [Clostridia bacterium]|nr:substrate-binding domain-containing protein [Clostridia bacterium]
MKKRLHVVLTILMIAVMTVCIILPAASAEKKLKFGYVINDMSHEWYQNVANGAKIRAEELGIDLMVADAAMDAGKQVTQLENMLADGVDMLLITPVDAKSLAAIIKQANDLGVPVLTESNFVEGALTMVGIDNFTGGKKAGLWFAEYAAAHNIDPKILVVGFPAFEDCRQRVDGFKAGMEEAGLAYEVLQEVDSNGAKEIALRVSQDAITAHPDVNVIFGINDNSTSGGMAAYKEAGLDESLLTAIGFGFEGAVGRDLLLGGTPYKAAVAMFPDFMGNSLIDAAVKVADGETIPLHYESGTIVITPDNFDEFYTKEGDQYLTNFEAIRNLLNQ